MQIRETLNRNPMLVMGAVALLLVVAFLVVFNSGSDNAGVPQARFTVDDGKTYFGLDTKEAPPFDYGGQQAVQVFLFRCGEGDPFVGYLERYSADAKAVLKEAEEMSSRGETPNIQKIQAAGTQGRQVKKPGDKDWVSAASPAGTKIQMVNCPDGTPAWRAD